MKKVLSPLLLVLILTGAACAAAPQVPSRNADLTGVITSVDGDTILVEENPNEQSGSQKASVRVTADTALTTENGARATPDQLQVGRTVRVWFDGPVAESYPVQGRAAAIVIESD